MSGQTITASQNSGVYLFSSTLNPVVVNPGVVVKNVVVKNTSGYSPDRLRSTTHSGCSHSLLHDHDEA